MVWAQRAVVTPSSSSPSQASLSVAKEEPDSGVTVLLYHLFTPYEMLATSPSL